MNDFLSILFDRFRANKDITDRIFLLIQEDRELMIRYLDLVREMGRQTMNKEIGKAIKKEFNLTDGPAQNKQPKSTLIRSYQEYAEICDE